MAILVRCLPDATDDLYGSKHESKPDLLDKNLYHINLYATAAPKHLNDLWIKTFRPMLVIPLNTCTI